MNLRRGTIYSVLLAGAAAGMALLPVRPVEARSSFNPPLLPARFLAELSPMNGPGFALQQAAPEKKPANPGLPEGKGKDLAQKDCTTCHAANVWTVQHYTRDQWSSVIDNMVNKGLDAPDDDLNTITDYLAAHFGPTKSASPATPNAPAAPAAPPQ